MSALSQNTARPNFWQYALWLAVFTVFYNIAEGVVSIAYGVSDEALTLFGFGVDSFIEVMSGIGILSMVIRIRQNPNTSRSGFEITALRVTGTSFYLLAAGLGASALFNLFPAHKPSTTLPGLVISVVSIAIMWLLVAGKRKVGRALNSSPILADSAPIEIKPVDDLYGDWFLDYASYVILERAVPHIHDCFKPVQRRVLHGMDEL